MADPFTFEAVGTPGALQAELRVRRSPDATGDTQKPAPGHLKRGGISLALTFVGMFALPVILELINVPMLGLIGALLVFLGFGYGAFEVYRGLGLSGFGARFNQPDLERLEVAQALLRALASDLGDAEAMLIVLMGSIRGAEAKERTKKPSGAWVEIRGQEWLHFHGRSKDGARWTLRAVLTERAKIKMKARGSKTRLQHAEHIEVTRQAPPDQPLSSGTAATLRRMIEGHQALGPDLHVQGGRCNARKLTLKVTLGSQPRSERQAAARQQAGLAYIGRLGASPQVVAQDILLVANAVGRLAQSAQRG